MLGIFADQQLSVMVLPASWHHRASATLAGEVRLHMEMHQVRYFVAAARTLNFTRAAGECHVAQPSLTRAVKLLEAELGGELFRRERSLTHLTDFGRLMLPVLSQILESALTAKVLAQSYRKQGQAPLHLAISRTIPMEFLSPHFHALTAAFPRVEV